MVSMKPCPGTSKAMHMATWESDGTVIQIPCDGKEVPTDVTGFPPHGDLLEDDERVVNTGNEQPDVWKPRERSHSYSSLSIDIWESS